MIQAYNAFIFCYGLAIQFAALFDSKAALWVNGRKNWAEKLHSLPPKTGKRVWFHCASLGEFEQARPLIETIKLHHPETQIVLSFFSPSGYEVRKTYTPADVVTYLPLDTPTNAKLFIDLVKPDAAFFVKYDLWYNYLLTLHKQKVPSVLFSAVFRPNQVFFKWYGDLFRKMLGFFNPIFVQNTGSKQLLKNINISCFVASDTRFDRVLHIAANRKSFTLVEKFCGNHPVFIAGSTWPSDEKLLFGLLKDPALTNWKWIIAPHNTTSNAICQIKNILQDDVVLYSALEEAGALNKKVLLIDNVGNLSSLYAYGSVAYIGGGFEKSVHNILEAAVYGIPVVFGKNFNKSEEAKDLLELGGAKCVRKPAEFNNVLLSVATDTQTRSQMGDVCKQYVHQRAGGTAQIYNTITYLLTDK